MGGLIVQVFTSTYFPMYNVVPVHRRNYGYKSRGFALQPLVQLIYSCIQWSLVQLIYSCIQWSLVQLIYSCIQWSLVQLIYSCIQWSLVQLIYSCIQWSLVQLIYSCIWLGEGLVMVANSQCEQNPASTITVTS